MIAGGLGSFEPRKPKIENLPQYEKKGVEYMVREPESFLGKKLFISGGGDSALDWAIYFAENHDIPVGLVHRTSMFRGHKDSVEKVYELQNQGKIELFTDAEVIDLHGSEKLEQIELKQKGKDAIKVNVDHWLPLFGLSPKLGPIANWGLEIEKNAIKVDNTLDYQTNIPGIFAIGDVNTYPGKLKLILCGFHEATLAVQTAYKIIHPDKRFTMKYTTVQGIQGFESDSIKA
jgi:thioredoxin reductase (NADPH)